MNSDHTVGAASVADTDTSCARAGSSFQRPTLRAAASMALMTGLVGGTLLPAFAAVGGGGAGGGGGSGAAGDTFAIYTYDNADETSPGYPKQGWGQDSINFFVNKATHDPNHVVPSGQLEPNKIPGYFNTACGEALAQATARGRKAHPEVAQVKSRVVQVGMSLRKFDTRNGKTRYVVAGSTQKAFQNSYKQQFNTEQDKLLNYDETMIRTVYDEFMAHILPHNPRVTCVALNQFEPKEFGPPAPPPIPPYELTLTTDHQRVEGMKVGSTAPVHDVIHADNHGSKVVEDVQGTMHLYWVGPGKGGYQLNRSKPVTIHNTGDTTGPEFTPSDFGWDSWRAGNYYWDVDVPKAGKMKAAYATPEGDDDPRERFVITPNEDVNKELFVGDSDVELPENAELVAGQRYDAHISADNSGFTGMALHDTIMTDQVFVGSATADDTSKIFVLGPDGQKVDSSLYTISVDRIPAEGGNPAQVKVTAKIGNSMDEGKKPIPADKQGTYTLVVPTYVLPNGKAYDVPDESSVQFYGSDVKKGPHKSTRKVTPKPDKAWVKDVDQGKSTADPDWTNLAGADNQTFIPGDRVGSVVNASIHKNMPEDLKSFTITDDWTGAAKYVDLSDDSKAKVFVDGKDVTDQFTIKTTGSITKAVAKPSILKGTKGLSADRPVKLILDGKFIKGYDTNGKKVELTNKGSMSWNGEAKPTNVPSIFTVTPKPNKVWAVDKTGALQAVDSEWTNAKGADNAVFLPGDDVFVGVHGSVPAGLSRALTSYGLTDDWSGAAAYLTLGTDDYSVYVDGKDRSSEFEVTAEGTTINAEAKKGSKFLAETAGLSSEREVTLVLKGRFKQDYQLHGEKSERLVNKGSEHWNDARRPTNEPPVFTWTPDPHKMVLGAEDENAAKNTNINGLSAFPGQKLSYRVAIDAKLPPETVKPISSLSAVDSYDPQFVPNKKSLRVLDTRNGKESVIGTEAYTATWDDKTHSVTVTFTPEWLKANTGATKPGVLFMEFDGMVSPDAKAGSAIENRAVQITNGVSTATETPVVHVPVVEPHKEDLNTDLQNIDGKTVIKGDHLLYRLTLDAGPSRKKLAYDVAKLGMVDDYDEKYLDVKPENVRLLDMDSGEDVTSKANVQVKDGRMAIFFKQVDSTNAKGEKIPGDPQPTDLFAYNQAIITPGTTPIIDQSVLGKKYYVMIDATVKKSQDGYVIKNQAIQNIQNRHLATEIVSNPLKKINPKKDVVVAAKPGENSINNTEIALNGSFNYRLDSSEIPANRAYKSSDWSISDSFDASHDLYTGQWAVYAKSDVYDGQKLVYKKGDLIDQSMSTENAEDIQAKDAAAKAGVAPAKDAVDESSAKKVVAASADDGSAVAESPIVGSQDDAPASSADAATPSESASPDAPSGDSVKAPKAKSDKASSAVQSDSTHGMFVGHWDKKTNTFRVEATPKYLKLVNSRMDLPQSWSAFTQMTRVAPGEVIKNVHDETYNKVKRASNVVVTKTLEHPSIHLEKYTLSEGVKKGDRDDVKNAYQLPAQDVKDENGGQVAVGFEITNPNKPGAVPLTHISLKDLTIGKTKGKVVSIMCTAPVSDAQKAVLDAGSKAKATDSTAGSMMSAEELAKSNVVLKPGGKITCEGELEGVNPGELHSDKATVTGESVFTHTKVSSSDPWHAKRDEAPKAPPATPEKKTPPPHGAVTGDPVTGTDAGLLAGGLLAGLIGSAAGFVGLRKLRSKRED